MTEYDGMTCQDCKRPFSEVMDFLVATPIWNYVMAAQERTLYTVRQGLFTNNDPYPLYPRVEGVGGVVCLACFDTRARAAGVNYRDSLIVFGIDCWMGYRDCQMPLVSPGAEQDWDATAEPRAKSL